VQRGGETPIYGPYEYFNQFRVVTRRGGKRTTLYQTFATRDLADAFIAGARDEAQGVTVKQSVERFLAWKRELQLAGSSVESAEDRLAMIGRTKTGAGTRRLLIPDDLTPYLVAIAEGRAGDAPLFVSEASRRWPAGRRRSRHMPTTM
jgi:hypothetical protein